MLIMYHALLTLHVTGVCLVVGTLFVQSLAVIFRLRLNDPAQIEGARWIQNRIYLFIYYPILVINIATGLYLALSQGLFSAEGQRWLHWKLMFLVLLIIFGFMNGRQINNPDLPKPLAMFVHIGIFCVSAVMIYLAQARPL